MKGFKKLSGAIVFSLVVSVLTLSTAFADTPNNNVSTTTTVSSTVYGGWLQQIDSLYNQVISLRQQDKDLDALMKAQHDLNNAAIKKLWSGINKEDVAKIKAVEEKNKDLIKSKEDAFEQLKKLRLELKVAEKTKDEKLTFELKLQIADLNNQLKPVLEQIKDNNDSIKEIKIHVETVRKQIQKVLAPLKPLEQQMRTLWSSNKALEEKRNDDWHAFDVAVNQGDIDGAIHSLTQVVSVKAQIIDLKKQIYTIQQHIGAALDVNTN